MLERVNLRGHKIPRFLQKQSKSSLALQKYARIQNRKAMDTCNLLPCSFPAGFAGQVFTRLQVEPSNPFWRGRCRVSAVPKPNPPARAVIGNSPTATVYVTGEPDAASAEVQVTHLYVQVRKRDTDSRGALQRRIFCEIPNAPVASLEILSVQQHAASQGHARFSFPNPSVHL